MRRIPSTDGWLGPRLRTIVFSFSLVILVTSLIDLFVNRLLFRAGPDFLRHVVLPVFYLALVGRISITLEQFLLFATLVSASILLLIEGRRLPRILGLFLITIVGCSALLYAPLPSELSWVMSALLVLSVAFTIPCIAFFGVVDRRELHGRKRLALTVLLICLILSFIFPLYYRAYLLLGSEGVASLPFPLEAYEAGIFLVMATTIGAFAYALSEPSPGFKLSYRNFAIAAVLPTLLVMPILYGVMRSFFVAQILTLVVAMSTDFILSHDLLRGVIVSWWFFLTAIFVLLLKGHYSTNRRLRQEAIGLVLIMSTSFLFNYPYYLMLGTTGMLLLCYPFSSSNEARTA